MTNHNTDKPPLVTAEMIDESFNGVSDEHITITLDSMSMYSELMKNDVPRLTPNRNLHDVKSNALRMFNNDHDSVREIEDSISRRLSIMGLSSDIGPTTALSIARRDAKVLYLSTESKDTTSDVENWSMPQFLIDDWILQLEQGYSNRARHWEKHIPRTGKSMRSGNFKSPLLNDEYDFEVPFLNPRKHRVVYDKFSVLLRVKPQLPLITRVILSVFRKVPLNHIDSNDEFLYSIYSNYPQIAIYLKFYSGENPLQFSPRKPDSPFREYILEDTKVYLNYLNKAYK